MRSLPLYKARTKDLRRLARWLKLAYVGEMDRKTLVWELLPFVGRSL